MKSPNRSIFLVFAVLAILVGACAPAATPVPPTDTPAPPTITPIPPTKTPTPLALPPIPEFFPRTNEAECEWQKQILGAWIRKAEDQSVETLTFKPDNTLVFVYEGQPDKIRVGTYICETGGTLKIFTQAYVKDKPEMLMVLGRIEVTFPTPDALKMDIKPAKQVWEYERVK